MCNKKLGYCGPVIVHNIVFIVDHSGCASSRTRGNLNTIQPGAYFIQTKLFVLIIGVCDVIRY